MKTPRIKQLTWMFIVSCVLASSNFCAAQLEVHKYDVVKPFLKKHCISCHGPNKQKGNFRIDKLGNLVKSQAEAEDWQEILDLINAGEMPPSEEPQPTKAEFTAVLEALYKTTSDARDIIAKKSAGKMRRMNRREYLNTLEDRLGIRPKQELLPTDPGDFGFDTFSSELVVTPTQLEGYLATGEELIGRLIKSNASPKTMSPQAKLIFGDLSAYVETKRIDTGSKKKKKKYRNETSLKSPPDNLAKPILQRYVKLLYTGREPSQTLLRDMEGLFSARRKRGMDFWKAIIDPMVVALTSPNFIYVVEAKESLTQIEIANRMALLFWGAASPDKELVDLARANKLVTGDTFLEQITRMLKNPKAERFYNSFGDQWLELDRLDLVVIDNALFPDVAKNQKKIKDSMRIQVRTYLWEVLSNNRPARLLVSSDFTMVDPLLADFYGIDYPDTGSGFQKVQLTGKNIARGGILGTGAVQMLTSTGSRTSPVERGVYILRKFLDRSPPPPPADVPEIEEDLKNVKSTRELLAHHSTTAQCATCHDRIDPLGFGMESFGPMGRFQAFENQHAKAKGKVKKIPVDTKGKMPNGDAFGSYDQLKDLLAEKDEQIARSYVKALMSYAIGRPVGFGDRSEIDSIIEKSRKRNFNLAELTYHVCISPQFRTKN